MNQGQTLFAQVMAHAPHREFQRCVRRYRGDARVRHFTCWDHFPAFEKTPVEQALSAAGYISTDGDSSNQLQLFDF